MSARILRAAAALKLVLPPGEVLEPQCVKLVEALNMLPGITTTSSCGCCDPNTYYVIMAADSVADLLPLAMLLQKPSCREWMIELTIETGWYPRQQGQPPQVRFALRTRERIEQDESWTMAENLAARIRREARSLLASHPVDLPAHVLYYMGM